MAGRVFVVVFAVMVLLVAAAGAMALFVALALGWPSASTPMLVALAAVLDG